MVLVRIYSSITKVDKNEWEAVIGKNKLLSYDYSILREPWEGNILVGTSVYIAKRKW